MNCEEFRQALAEELGIEPARRDEAAAHVASCDECRALASAAERLRRDLELERSSAATSTRGGEDDGGTAERRFDLLLAAWRSGAADASGERGGRVTAPIVAPNRWRRVAAALVWMAVGAAGGGLAAHRWEPPPAAPPVVAPAEPIDDSPRFFLALLEHFSEPLAPPPSAPTSAEVEQKIVGEYVAWARSLDERGLLVDADRLSDESYAYLHVRTGKIAVEDELLDGGSHLGGFYLVRAKDLDAAIELARQSPHLKYGGEIEIRAVVRSGGER
jgi:hypothetical protein